MEPRKIRVRSLEVAATQGRCSCAAGRWPQLQMTRMPQRYRVPDGGAVPERARGCRVQRWPECMYVVCTSTRTGEETLYRRSGCSHGGNDGTTPKEKMQACVDQARFKLPSKAMSEDRPCNLILRWSLEAGLHVLRSVSSKVLITVLELEVILPHSSHPSATSWHG